MFFHRARGGQHREVNQVSARINKLSSPTVMSYWSSSMEVWMWGLPTGLEAESQGMGWDTRLQNWHGPLTGMGTMLKMVQYGDRM